MEEVKRRLKEVPYFIQGSFVLDSLYNRRFHRDIDIFCKKGKKDKIPRIEKRKFHHITEIDRIDLLLGCYNLDRYFILPEGNIIFPKGYAKKTRDSPFASKEKDSNMCRCNPRDQILPSVRFGTNDRSRK